jgi:hypothetical protein
VIVFPAFFPKHDGAQFLDLELQLINGPLLFADKAFEDPDVFLELTVFVPQIPDLESLLFVEVFEIPEPNETLPYLFLWEYS